MAVRPSSVMCRAARLRGKAGATSSSVLSTAAHGAQTIHLFTVDNIQPVIVPWTVVGICSALAGPALTDTSTTPDFWHIAARAPYALFWLWLNILIFAIGNQRLPDAIDEDKINKPWRALPSGRLSMDQAKALLLFLVPIDVVVGTWLGASHMTTLAIVLSYLYNDLGGADFHWFIRNLINAFAMAVASTGTTMVSMYDERRTSASPFCTRGYVWAFLQAALVMTTLQIQDLRDQEGDKARGRSTMPVDIGDNFTRWSIVATVMPWSLACAAFWAADGLGTAIVVTLGGYLSARVLLYRDVRSDKRSWKLWGLWTLVIFMLPLYTHPASLHRLVR